MTTIYKYNRIRLRGFGRLADAAKAYAKGLAVQGCGGGWIETAAGDIICQGWAEYGRRLLVEGRIVEHVPTDPDTLTRCGTSYELRFNIAEMYRVRDMLVKAGSDTIVALAEEVAAYGDGFEDYQFTNAVEPLAKLAKQVERINQNMVAAGQLEVDLEDAEAKAETEGK